MLTSLTHEVTTHTSRIKEFVEQAAVPARIMYASPNSRSTHRVVPLDVPSPSWMRAPGEAPGMFALESAMDELAVALGMDPVELRIVNEPDTEPDSGRPFSSRHLVECLRDGAERFGWSRRDHRPGSRSEGALLLGSGVAAATYPVLVSPSTAVARARPDGTFSVGLNATDIGTGARTVLAQIAADALGVPLARVDTEIGSSDLPSAPLAAWFLGHRVLGLGRPRGLHPAARVPRGTFGTGARRGSRDEGRHSGNRGRGQRLRAPCLRRPLRGGRGGHGHRRGPGAAGCSACTRPDAS